MPRKLNKEIPIWEKCNLTIEEACQYSNIGDNKMRELLNSESCSFVLCVGPKKLVKRKLFEQYLDEEYSI